MRARPSRRDQSGWVRAVHGDGYTYGTHMGKEGRGRGTGVVERHLRRESLGCLFEGQKWTRGPGCMWRRRCGLTRFPAARYQQAQRHERTRWDREDWGCCEAIEVPGNIEMSGHVEEPNSSSGEELDLKEELYTELRGLAALVSGLNGRRARAACHSPGPASWTKYLDDIGR